jgi:hypothetical protein
MAEDSNDIKTPLLNRLLVALIRWFLIAVIVIAIGIIVYGLLPAEQQQQVRDIQQDLQQEMDERIVPKAQSVIENLKQVGDSTESPDQ